MLRLIPFGLVWIRNARRLCSSFLVLLISLYLLSLLEVFVILSWYNESREFRIPGRLVRGDRGPYRAPRGARLAGRRRRMNESVVTKWIPNGKRSS
jgi:hypothetical protein